MLASNFIEYLISAYDLKHEGTCDGTKDAFRINVTIGSKSFFGFTKDDKIPPFDLMVDLSEGLVISIDFHLYKCPKCDSTSSDKMDPSCDCESTYTEISAPPNKTVDLSTI